MTPSFPDVGHGVERALDLRVAPHLVIADADEPAPVETGGAHLVVGRRQPLQHRVVDALPVGAVVDGAALIAPPDDVAAVDDEFGAPRIDVLDDLARHPLAALEPEHRAMDAGKQLDVLDRRLGDPALVHRQRHHLGLGHERHDDLDELLGVGIEGHPHIFLHHLFGDPFRHHEAEHLDEELDEVRLARARRQVHHRPRVADRGEGEAALRRGALRSRRTRQQRRRQRRKRGQSREQRPAVDA